MTDERGAALDLVRALLDGLDERAIGYCLWKSTARIDEVLGGRTDFDILVSEAERDAWEQLIGELGFKAFVSHPSRRYPGIEDRIGYDEPSGRLVHLHVHYQLILGQQYVKNHRLPIETELLAATTTRDGVRVPPPEVELAILTLRALLKYRDSDAYKDLLGLGERGGMPPDIVAEVLDLADRIDPGQLAPTLAAIAPMIPAELVEAFRRTILDDRRDAARLLRLRRRARAVMAPYQRLPARQADRRYFAARVARQWPVSLLTKSATRRQARRKTPARGGSTIAIIGADGSGKTTQVEDVVSWLSGRIRIKTYYMGSARPSRATGVVRRAAKASRRLDRVATRTTGSGSRLARRTRRLSDVLTAVRAVGDARDRRDRFIQGTADALDGTVVIFDRFPLPGVSLGERYVDGPTIPAEAEPPLDRLGREERQLYASIGRPDHVVALEVSPTVATERRQPRDPAALEAKCRAVHEWQPSPDLDVVRVDTELPLDDVRATVRRTIWSWL